MELRITRSARKHRIGNAHILAALRNAGEPVPDDDALLYSGIDDRGVELEIVIVPDDRNDSTWAVIHVLPADYRRKP